MDLVPALVRPALLSNEALSAAPGGPAAADGELLAVIRRVSLMTEAPLVCVMFSLVA